MSFNCGVSNVGGSSCFLSARTASLGFVIFPQAVIRFTGPMRIGAWKVSNIYQSLSTFLLPLPRNSNTLKVFIKVFLMSFRRARQSSIDSTVGTFASRTCITRGFINIFVKTAPFHPIRIKIKDETISVKIKSAGMFFCNYPLSNHTTVKSTVRQKLKGLTVVSINRSS
jgi:hypothetical protein